MNWVTLTFLFGLISLCHGVILSLEESEMGAHDYRYFYLTTPDYDSNTATYQKPYFNLVNDNTSRPYGALGSLYCGSSTDGIAVYSDVGNGYNEWTCQTINLLPFAHQGGGPPSPPICEIGTTTGLPAQWNSTANSWVCGQYNEILTFATREDITVNCQTADFMMMFASVDQIRCVDPKSIDPALTLNGRDEPVAPVIEERVDPAHDNKWHTIMSDYDMTALTSRAWTYWRWSPYLNYDSTSQSSLVASPPAILPFPTTLIAITLGSFRISSYNWYAAPPSGSDTFTGNVYKLSSTLVPTTISNTIVFNSISATSGHMTVGLSTVAGSSCVAGEAFVADISARTWAAFTSSSDRQAITITLWLQTQESFTEFWPVS